MFGFVGRQDLEKEIALPFKVVLEARDDGYFLAKVPGLPGCTARGRSKSEALKNAEQAVRLRLGGAAAAAFEVVWEDPAQKVVHCALPFFGRLVAATNRDSSLASTSGDFGSWTAGQVGKAGPGRGAADSQRPDAEEGGADGLLDYTPQVYCLAAYSGTGVAKLYAGTSSSGSIYESMDGLGWELSTATGEDRVHCLAEFRGRLYAGTSGQAKLFCYTGSHWSPVYRGGETAITAAAEFHGELFIGTYPSGHIYASADGINWHLAFDSGQTFVRSLAEFDGALYAATSKAGGGAVFRSDNGLRWEKVFETKDPNFYCLHVFHHALWLGSGNQGRLYRSQDGSAWTLAAALEDEGIRGMASYDGRLYLATEGRGRIYRSAFADTPPPILSDIRFHDVTSHSAVVSWRTDRPSDGRVLYGVDELLDSVHASAFSTEHRLALSYLKAHTLYRVQVLSRGSDGSEAGFSGDLSFSTGGAETASLSSGTHPLGEAWSAQGEVLMQWFPPEGVPRFHWCVDHSPETLPEPGSPGVRATTERSASFDLEEEGLWWFHLRCEDRAGNLGSAASHYRLGVDLVAAPPRLASPSHAEGAWSNNPKAVFTWESPADLSGIVGYCVLLDRKKASLPTLATGIRIEEPRYTVELPEDGEWWLHVVSMDAAGNVGAEAAHYSLKLDRRADPPSVESGSHPDPSRWFNTAQILLHWEAPSDLSGVTGYYTLLDQRPESVPSAHTGAFTALQSLSYNGKTDGIWYFHIVSADAAGNVGTEAAHYCIRIDTWAAPPEISSPTHPSGTWVPSGRVVFELKPPADLSGTLGYYWLLDKDPQGTPGAERGAYTHERSLEFNDLADGLWHLHVVSKDAAGNVGGEAAHCAVRIDTEAKPPMLRPFGSSEEWTQKRQGEMSWEAPEDLSGVAQYWWILDQDPATVPTAHSGTRCLETRVRVEAPQDGLWWFHVVTEDRAGNVGREAAHCRLKVDTEALAPRLFCPTHPDRKAWSNHTRPRFEWHEPEDSSGIAGYYWSFDQDEGTVPSAATGVYTTERYAVVDRGVESEGEWWFHVTSRDRAGNVGLEASHWPVRVDTTAQPPALRSSTHPDRNAWSKNPNPVFEWDAPKDYSGIAGYFYVLNRSPNTLPSESNGAWTEDCRAVFSGLEDGMWTLHVVSKDRCGNVGPDAAHYGIRIDTQALPPQVSSPTHPEGAWTRNAAPTFTWTPPQDAAGVAGYYYALDREPATVPAPPKAQYTTATQVSFPKLQDGLWIFHIVTADAAGNVGTRAAHHSIRIDTAAGLAKLSSAGHPDQAQWYRDPNPIVSWTPPNDPSGIGGYYWSVDQQPDTVPGLQGRWTTETQAAPGPLPDGEWCFHVSTKDGAGNLSTEASHFRLRIDTQAPKPRVYSKSHPDPAAWGASASPSFVWEDGDDASGIAGHFWVFDNNANAPVVPGQAQWTTEAGVTLPPQKDGIWTFALAAKDRAGNVSEPVRVGVKIETQPPSSKLEPLPALCAKKSFEVRWKGEDRVSGVAHYDVQVREGEKGPWRPWQTETTATSAQYAGKDGVDVAFRVRAHDRAGNAEPWPLQGPWVHTLVDLSPPEPVVNLDAKPGPGGSVNLSWSPALDSGSGVGGYEVWRGSNAQEQGTCVSPPGGVDKAAFTDPGKDLEDGALYHYAVLPFDKAGNKRKEGNPRVSCVCDRTALVPSLSSPTHPDPREWSRQTTALLRWEQPEDASGIAGYYWTLDQSPDSLPNPAAAKFVEKPELELAGLKDGAWVAHVATKDLAGNLSKEAGHYRLNIDTQPPPAPVVRSTTHGSEAWSEEADAEFQWSVPPDASKIAGYYWLVDQAPATVPGPPAAAGGSRYSTSPAASVKGLADGVWWFHVAAMDRAGNAGVQAGHYCVRVTHGPPPPPLSSPTHPRPEEGYANRTAVFHWSTPQSRTPVSAWHYCLDQIPDTVPDQRAARTTELRAEFNDLAAGDWWFHIVSVGPDGGLGRLASHFPARVRSAGSLQGQVTKPNGMLPQEGALLEVFRQGKSVAKTAAGKDGRFRFDGLDPGEVLVKLDLAGLPSLLVDGVKLDGASSTLNLSCECMAWPSPTEGAAQIRFAVLAREPGKVGLKLYTETGQGLGEMEAAAPRAGYVKLTWNCSEAPAGSLLWQATVTSADGKAVKFPIRKLRISR
ncbi:MAG TPA: hypothetical protein VK914_08670 [bacterium]|jgi:predicted RNase H-like HicB family nuclease|nr:hypothetical protein [bacterium]